MCVSDHMEKFDPSAFGLTGKYIGSGRGGKRTEGKNYIIKQRNGKNRMTLSIVLANPVANRVEELISDNVNFDFNKDGIVFLWKGKSRHITKQSNRRRATISVGSMYEDYTKHMGDFRRLYIKPEYCGNHIKLIPTGERDI